MSFGINNNNQIDRTSTQYDSPNAVEKKEIPFTDVASSHQHFSLSRVVSTIKQFFVSIRRSNFEFLKGIRNIPEEELSPRASRRLGEIKEQLKTPEDALKLLYLDKGSKLYFSQIGQVSALLRELGKGDLVPSINYNNATLPIKNFFEYVDEQRLGSKKSAEATKEKVIGKIEEQLMQKSLPEDVIADAVATLAILNANDSEDVVKNQIENMDPTKVQGFCKGFVKTYRCLDELGLVPTKLSFVGVMEGVGNGKIGIDQLKKAFFDIKQLLPEPNRRSGARTPEAIAAKKASTPPPQNNYDIAPSNNTTNEQVVEDVLLATEKKPKIPESYRNVPTPPPVPNPGVEGVPPPPPSKVNPNSSANASSTGLNIDASALASVKSKLKPASERQLAPEPLTPQGQEEPKWNPNLQARNPNAPVQLVPNLNEFKAELANKKLKSIPLEKKQVEYYEGPILQEIKKGIKLNHVELNADDVPPPPPLEEEDDDVPPPPPVEEDDVPPPPPVEEDDVPPVTSPRTEKEPEIPVSYKNVPPPPPVPNSGVEGVPPPPPSKVNPNSSANASSTGLNIDASALASVKSKLKPASERQLAPEPLTPQGQEEPKWNPNLQARNPNAPVQLVPNLNEFKAELANKKLKSIPLGKKQVEHYEGPILQEIKKGIKFNHVDLEAIEKERKERIQLLEQEEREKK